MTSPNGSMTCIAPASVRTTQTKFAFSKKIPPGRTKNFWNNAQPIRAAQSIVTFHPLQNKMPCHFSPYKNESEKWQNFLIGNDRTPESRALTLYLKAPRAIMAKTKNAREAIESIGKNERVLRPTSMRPQWKSALFLFGLASSISNRVFYLHLTHNGRNRLLVGNFCNYLYNPTITVYNISKR